MQIDPNAVQWDDQPAQAPSFPGVIRGQISPSKAADEARKNAAEVRANEDQAMQRENLRLSQENAARSARKDAEGTVEQGKSAGFLLRALQANDAYQAQEIGARSWVGQKMAANTPDALNMLPEAIGNSPRRQVADANQNDFIAATLRYESGAAIPPEEMEAQRARYFPMPGDSDEVIKAKAQLRATAVEALAQSSGPLADSTYAKFQNLTKTGKASDAKDLGESIFGTDQPPGLTGTVTDTRPNDPTPPDGGIGGDIKLDPRLYNPEGAQGIFDLAKQGITMGLSDEAAGAGGYLAALFTGGDPSKAYTRERDTARENLRRAREARPVIGTLAEFLGGGAGAKIANGVSTIGSMIRRGSGLGALGGFGYGKGDNSLASAAGGAVVGGALGGALGLGGRLVANRIARNALSPEQVNVIEAGQRQGIPMRQPDVRPALRNELAQVETTGAGGPIIQQARAGDAAAIEARVSDIGGAGVAADPYTLGGKVQEAGRNYIARTKVQAGRLYDKARDLSGGQTVQPKEALAALDQEIADLRATGENANAAAISYLSDVRADLAKDGGVSIDAIRNIRTNMRGQISERGLTGTDTDRRVMAAIEGANLDMARDLPPEAAQAFKAADAFYKERQDFISNTLKTVMGDRNNPLPPETAAARLTAMTKGKGNFDRFSSMWKELSPEDRADTAATIAETLGRKANGEFSVPALIKSLDPNKGLNPRTARLLFGDDGARALEDLRMIAAAKDETQRAMNNSRTGTAVNAAGDSLRTLLWGLFGFTQGGPVGAAGGAAARGFITNLTEKRAARMLMNPDFTKLLRNAPNTNDPATINRYFSRIAGVLAANDNEAFTGAIAAAFRKSPGSAAAQDETDSRRKPPQ